MGSSFGVISQAIRSNAANGSVGMWKRNKFHPRRVKFASFVKLLVVAVLTAFVWMVHKSDVNPHDINGDLLDRIWFGKSREDLTFEKEIESDLAKQVPGLCNGGVECSLSGDDESLGVESYATYGINVFLSDKISYNRTPPDVRNYLCSMLQYDTQNLPSASVVIIFLDEPYSALIRTVHSVLNTAPSILLKEIILVDDFSSSTDLKGKLSHYVKTRLPSNVKLLRLEKQ